MRKLNFLLVVVLFTQTRICAQATASTFSSTSVDIIHPVGTENSGELFTGVFIPGKETRVISMSKPVFAGNENKDLLNFETPTFQVTGSQFIYSVTFTYDAFILHRNTKSETMQVESLSILPVYDKESDQFVPGTFSIGAKFKVGASQLPGHYSTASPCRVTIHFN